MRQGEACEATDSWENVCRSLEFEFDVSSRRDIMPLCSPINKVYAHTCHREIARGHRRKSRRLRCSIGKNWAMIMARKI